ncbi:Sec-independent protein translocase protein TatA (modular protein) [Candidatus Sulfobium mesophilum]|jgi:Tat protein translocase TatB subunit|uniref:Sec-independent protein translocase protein TatA (Modular protein) n=1 Tax=Candidatus Sulfobium mesophilum TaxID=2016548 RepID=A0A2U3QGY9_9BACT|nr:Sec-independent protein translocase protein TatA (modular protein) [Candidatus Sulfobium mesophilum]
MSSGELVIIFIVAFLVFGPERLPELARKLGKWLFEIKRAAQDVKVHMETEIASSEKEVKEKETPGEPYPQVNSADKPDDNNK